MLDWLKSRGLSVSARRSATAASTRKAPANAGEDAWTLAGRTATVNLLAQSVVFDRDTG
jgi:hypothetical protein